LIGYIFFRNSDRKKAGIYVVQYKEGGHYVVQQKTGNELWVRLHSDTPTSAHSTVDRWSFLRDLGFRDLGFDVFSLSGAIFDTGVSLIRSILRRLWLGG